MPGGPALAVDDGSKPQPVGQAVPSASVRERRSLRGLPRKPGETVTTSHSGMVLGKKTRAFRPCRRGAGGSKQTSPVHSEAGSCLRRANSNKAWKGPGGPREQTFQMNSTHWNRKQDTI